MDRLVLILLSCFLMTVILIINVKGNKLAVFWGTNSVSLTQAQNEYRLRYYCARGVYDTVIITTLTANPTNENAGSLPSLNFANHCLDNPLQNNQYKSYLKCPQIENDIKYCQQRGIKVLLDIGGSSTTWLQFDSKNEAKLFALQVWNLFLGGGTQESLRTFGRAILDGINLSLKRSPQKHTIDFVREMRRIMDEKRVDKRYLLTASPTCLVTRDHPLTPTFDGYITAFDSLYVSFSQPICSLDNAPSFEATLQTWLVKINKNNNNNNPLITPNLHIGISASNVFPDTSFVQPNTLNKVYKDITSKHDKIKGLILDNAGLDDYRSLSGRPYSQIVSDIIKDMYNKRPLQVASSSSSALNSPTSSNAVPQQHQQQQQDSPTARDTNERRFVFVNANKASSARLCSIVLYLVVFSAILFQIYAK